MKTKLTNAFNSIFTFVKKHSIGSCGVALLLTAIVVAIACTNFSDTLPADEDPVSQSVASVPQIEDMVESEKNSSDVEINENASSESEEEAFDMVVSEASSSQTETTSSKVNSQTSPQTETTVSKSGNASSEKKECFNHDFPGWTVVKEPTTSSGGLKESVCIVCGYKRSESIPKLVETKVEGVDSQVTIQKHPLTGQPLYTLNKCRVLDKRTWGDAPLIEVVNGNSMHVTYFNKNNEKVEFDVVPLADMSAYTLRFTILDDGTYVSQLTGAFS